MARLPGWLKRDHRDPVSMSGNAVLPDGKTISVRVSDLSTEGCRVETEQSLPIGERVTLNVEALRGIPASVRWSFLRNAGLRFEDGDWT